MESCVCPLKWITGKNLLGKFSRGQSWNAHSTLKCQNHRHKQEGKPNHSIHTNRGKSNRTAGAQRGQLPKSNPRATGTIKLTATGHQHTAETQRTKQPNRTCNSTAHRNSHSRAKTAGMPHSTASRRHQAASKPCWLLAAGRHQHPSCNNRFYYPMLLRLV